MYFALSRAARINVTNYACACISASPRARCPPIYLLRIMGQLLTPFALRIVFRAVPELMIVTTIETIFIPSSYN